MDDNDNNVEKLEEETEEDNENNVVKCEEETHDEEAQKTKSINKVKLAIYTGLVLVPMVTLITMICSSVIDYSRWPIYTETNIRKQNEANFPSLTFCPTPNGYKSDILKVNSRL